MHRCRQRRCGTGDVAPRVAALTAYLQSEKVAVNAVVIHPTTQESLAGGGGYGWWKRRDRRTRVANDGGHQKGVIETAFRQY